MNEKETPVNLSQNNSSLVLKILYGKDSFLFTGDAEQEAEKHLALYASFLKSEVLKVGHHGSVTSSGKQFLEYVDPEYAVISVGRKNKFNHPSQKTINICSCRKY